MQHSVAHVGMFEQTPGCTSVPSVFSGSLPWWSAPLSAMSQTIPKPTSGKLNCCQTCVGHTVLWQKLCREILGELYSLSHPSLG